MLALVLVIVGVRYPMCCRYDIAESRRFDVKRREGHVCFLCFMVTHGYRSPPLFNLHVRYDAIVLLLYIVYCSIPDK